MRSRAARRGVPAITSHLVGTALAEAHSHPPSSRREFRPKRALGCTLAGQFVVGDGLVPAPSLGPRGRHISALLAPFGLPSANTPFAWLNVPQGTVVRHRMGSRQLPATEA